MRINSRRKKLTATQIAALGVGGVIAGFLATTAKMKAEGILQPAAEKIWPPTRAEKLQGGADPADHPENMPPTEIADRVQQNVPAVPDDDDTTAKIGAGLHWSMGVGSAVLYTFLSQRHPRLRVGSGAVAGLALYGLTHGSTLPVAKLQAPPWRMPTAAVAWEAGSHAVYGTTLELSLRAFSAFPTRNTTDLLSRAKRDLRLR